MYTRTSLRSLVLMVAVLFPGIAGAAESAAERPPEKVIIAYSSISGNMAPLWVTHDRGFFRKYGLDTQLVFIESGTTTVQSLISKDVIFAQMAGAGVVQSGLRGSDVVMIAGVINTLTFKFYVDKNIKQPDQLKGKTMAAILASLETGRIQGAMLSAPFTLRAKNMGFPLMADLQMLGLEYQHTGLATTQALIKSRPDLVRNAMKAYVEGIHYYKTHRAESLAILAKYLKTTDSDILTEVYEDVGLKLTAEKPYPTLRGIEIMLRELAATNPKAMAARPEEFVDLTFIKELDSSGFIDRLYKTTPVVASREEQRLAPAPTSIKEKSAPASEKTKPIMETAKSLATLAPAAGSREYTVEPGDTLSYIARKYYGNHLKWDKIYQANKPIMKNPDYIYVGQRIIIPS
jgi:NitT/TauT family transport system substrate-binding protein